MNLSLKVISLNLQNRHHFSIPDGPVALHGEGDNDVDGRAEDGAPQREEDSVADHVERVALGEEVDARSVGEREGDEAVVRDHQGCQEAVEYPLQLLTWRIM